VAYYPLNEGEGTVAHCVTDEALNGTFHNPTWIVDGHEQRSTASSNYSVPPSPVTLSWAGRRVTWKNVSLNGEGNYLKCMPKQEVKITLEYDAIWNYSSNDYCPGCIVQVYYGMQETFTKGIIEFGIQRHTGKDLETFTAPNIPGIYYITQNISLDYHYVPVNHSNLIGDALAVIHVVPLTWNEDTYRLLPSDIQQQIKTVMLMALRNPKTEAPRHPETLWHRVPHDILMQIAQYLYS